MLTHHRLVVYQRATQFVCAADTVVAQLPRGRGYLSDQLRRAATSIMANIAEGAGEFKKPEKARFYRMALRSASESSALLDACEQLNLVDAQLVAAAALLLGEVVAMLTTMVMNLTEGEGEF